MKDFRRAYAEELRIAGPVRKNRRILDAFAKVPRDKFLPPGPWRLHGAVSWRTPDADPRWVHHNVLVNLDKKQGINNGSPSLWAYLFDQLDIKPGERLFQIGAGSGYYTAILAHLVGKRGHVRAVEYDKRLARLARKNLAPLPQVELLEGDGSKCDPGEKLNLIVAYTGGTHVPLHWLERLAPGGRLLMPLVGNNTRGFMLRVIRRGKDTFAATALTHAYFYLAKGFRVDEEARKLQKIVKAMNNKLPKLRALHLGPVPKSQQKKAFYATRTFWLS